MLGEEHYIVILASSPAILQWYSRANGQYTQDHCPRYVEAGESRKRMVVICMPICRPHDEREKPYPLFGQLVGMWKSHDKAQAKSLDDRGCVGILLDIDIWQSGTTRVMQDGVVVKGLAPKRLDPARCHINPSTDLNELEKGMPWRSIQDEFGKFKWIDPSGRIYQGTPFSVEPDITANHVFIASTMHTSMRSQMLRDQPDATCPSDFPDSDKRKEVVHHEQIPDYDVKKHKRQHANDKKSNVVNQSQEYSSDTEVRGLIYGLDAGEMASVHIQGN